MAKSWDVTPDGLTITFHLRRGVKWHDGREFTSHDVLYTYLVPSILKLRPHMPTPSSRCRGRKLPILTPSGCLCQPFAPALESWGMSILPAHLLEGKDITKSELARHPIGSGRYIFREWVAGQKITLEDNPDYYEGRPYIGRYIYRIIPQVHHVYGTESGGDRQDGDFTDPVPAPDRFTRFQGPFQQIPYSDVCYISGL